MYTRHIEVEVEVYVHASYGGVRHSDTGAGASGSGGSDGRGRAVALQGRLGVLHVLLVVEEVVQALAVAVVRSARADVLEHVVPRGGRGVGGDGRLRL